MSSQDNNHRIHDSVFWIEVDRIKPNPYQPRKTFDENALKALSESIRQYGVLQPLVVSRNEVQTPDGGLMSEYELIAGERRLRASKMAGVSQVPAIIRTGQETDLMKLELAIIENLQREDLNPIDKARAFKQLVDEFGYKHSVIAKRIGRSREYVSNAIRLLALPEEMLQAVERGELTEGHARPLLMLIDRPEEQKSLFKEIVLNKITVREAEKISRNIAFDKVRKATFDDNPEVVEAQEKLKEALGTRVFIEKRQRGGKIVIDFYTVEELKGILDKISKEQSMGDKVSDAMEYHQFADSPKEATNVANDSDTSIGLPNYSGTVPEQEDDTNDLYAVTNFSL